MEVRLLGAFEVIDDDGNPIALPSAKQRALLAILALNAGRVVATERLVDQLWGDDAPRDAANALQAHVSKLRRTMGGPELLETRPPGYVLNLDPSQVDVARFEGLVAAGRDASDDPPRAAALLVEAEAQWRGAALADFAYEEWAQPLLARLTDLRLAAIEDRVQAELSSGADTSLISDLDALVSEHPLRERLRGQLMIALYRAGRQADALRVFQEGRLILGEQLGLEPGPELRRLEAAVLAQDESLNANSVSAIARSAPRPRRLPVPLTDLIGREGELRELTAIVAEQRLVTLVGPGGAGKTRLALDLARAEGARLEDGAVLVELAPVGDPDDVANAIATALEAPDGGSLADAIRDRELLLVLDNCEHVIDAAATQAEMLLQHCTRLRIIATSREALRVPGETAWPVPPLAPDDAVELFVQRARAVDPTFHADAEQLATIAEVCARLDGLPLAIELAAARTRSYPLAQIAGRLDDRFRLLTGGSRTALPRQQTLRAVVDWSYDLLFDAERRVFERLSVLPGGATLDAAEAVCADDNVPVEEIADVLGALVDKSLIALDLSLAQPRYRMLQTLAQYGRERLVERGDAEATRQRMARHFDELCKRSAAALGGDRQREWLLAVSDEHDNLRSVLEWAIDTGNAQLSVSIAESVGWQRWVAGAAAEGCRWIDEALAVDGEVEPITKANAYVWRAYLGYLAGDSTNTEYQFDEAMRLYRAADAVESRALALLVRAQTTLAKTDLARAESQVAEACALYESIPPTPWITAAIAFGEAILAQLRIGTEAFEARLREALRLYEATGDEFMFALTLGSVADFDERRGDYDLAAASLERAIEISVGLRLHGLAGSLLARLGNVTMLAGDLERADQLHERALEIAHDLAYPPVLALVLNGRAMLRRRQGRFDDAERRATQALDLYDSESGRGLAAYQNVRYHVPAGAAVSFATLGYVAEERGDAAEAARLHELGLRQAQRTGDSRAVALALEGLAGAAALAGDGDHAGLLLGKATQLRLDAAAPLPAGQRADVERATRAAIAHVGDAAFAASCQRGAAMDVDVLVPDDGNENANEGVAVATPSLHASHII